MYNPYSLENKTVLVTGASSGIGRATAIECAKLGATVVITGRNEERLNAVYEELDRTYSQSHQMIIADLATEEGMDKLMAEVPVLDGVSSNAGISKGISPIKFIKDELIDEIFNINLISHVRLARNLFKKKKLNKEASYVFTASIGGTTSFSIGNAVYGMSKSAINSFAKFCAVDFASRKIRCNAVCPGMIETPMTGGGGSITQEDYEKDKENYLVKRYGRPEEVAWATAYLLSDASSFITGISLYVDGGASIIK